MTRLWCWILAVFTLGRLGHRWILLGGGRGFCSRCRLVEHGDEDRDAKFKPGPPTVRRTRRHKRKL